MTETITEIAGRPIRGEISYYRTNPAAQKPITELLTALDAVLAFPEVEAIRWQQYTPYFNDGDACEFNTGEVYIKFVGKDDGGDYDDGYIDCTGDWPAGYFDTHAYEQHVQAGTDEFSSGMYGRRSVPRYEYRVPEGKLKVDYKDREFYVNGVVRNDIKDTFEAFAHLLGPEFYIDLLKYFGDPAEVVATRDGFNVEHYDHD